MLRDGPAIDDAVGAAVGAGLRRFVPEVRLLSDAIFHFDKPVDMFYNVMKNMSAALSFGGILVIFAFGVRLGSKIPFRKGNRETIQPHGCAVKSVLFWRSEVVSGLKSAF